jgi:hypothetical protein
VVIRYSSPTRTQDLDKKKETLPGVEPLPICHCRVCEKKEMLDLPLDHANVSADLSMVGVKIPRICSIA